MKNTGGLQIGSKYAAHSMVLRVLDYARYAVVGGIAGLSIYNTYMLIVAATPTSSAETLASSAGALIVTGLVKALHIV